MQAMGERAVVFSSFPIGIGAGPSVHVSPRGAVDEVAILFAGSDGCDPKALLSLACMMVGLEQPAGPPRGNLASGLSISTVEPFRVPPEAILPRRRPGVYATLVENPSRWMLRRPTGWAILRFNPHPRALDSRQEHTAYLDYVGGPPGRRRRVVVETTHGEFSLTGDPCILDNRTIRPGVAIQAIPVT
jgi:hypothetical protein